MSDTFTSFTNYGPNNLLSEEGLKEDIRKTIFHIKDENLKKILLHVENTLPFPHVNTDYLYNNNIWKTIFHMTRSEYGLIVLLFLLKYGCVSNLELWKECGFKVNRKTVKYHLEVLEELNVICQYSDLRETNIPKQYRNTKIWGWKALPPEYSSNAIKRTLKYFEIKNGKNTELPANLLFSVNKSVEQCVHLLQQRNSKDISNSKFLEICKENKPENISKVKFQTLVKKGLREKGFYVNQEVGRY